MPSFMDWAFGIIIAFLVFQLGSVFIPATGVIARLTMTLIFLFASAWIGWMVVHRGE